MHSALCLSDIHEYENILQYNRIFYNMTQYNRLLYNSKISVRIETGAGILYNCIVIRIQLRMHVTLCTCILYHAFF